MKITINLKKGETMQDQIGLQSNKCINIVQSKNVRNIDCLHQIKSNLATNFKIDHVIR